VISAPQHAQKAATLFSTIATLPWMTAGSAKIRDGAGVVTRLISRFEDASCKRCEGVYSPLIVPPTFYKDMNNVFLSTIWNRTDVALQSVNHIIFCGYSFPDADIHIKYLLKRSQTNRQGQLKFTVINHYENKSLDESRQEEYRYKRFLGEAVRYTALSFEDFTADPLSVLLSNGRPEQKSGPTRK
jgi:hypothetical protein